MLPVLRRSDLFFPDVDRMFDEMDEMMESPSVTIFPRPSLSLLGRDIPKEQIYLAQFEVTQDEKEYRVAVHVPDVEAKDVGLQLDHDGRVLRLKGDRTHEEGDIKVQSRFEKAILLSPDVDTTKLAANMSGDTLTVVTPKIEKKVALAKAENKRIETKIDEPNASLDSGVEPSDNAQNAPTRLAVENLKDETAETKQSMKGENRWAVWDFPYRSGFTSTHQLNLN
eukprot:CAMPEP_0201970440 /NCGR_PEP_ID=MMETSP0904-20121228/30981_1 /ASSEMBLY_ACC=CAM_ASM_000553 /TAXON_ID=420261 /ORGANISM="Thalassiosira antarctica, Strain CCMP982" /LENGTH=224 /DNA_ID=CAMNT_0048519375 /DNA_START=201 /DNA_END=876 /DNA_ORIENTATION=-